MGGLGEAATILRKHVIERRRRASVSSVPLDRDPTQSVPRMSEGEFVTSCSLVKGIPESTLDVLEVWVCESKGGTWTIDAVEIQGEVENIPLCQIALRLTLREAAERVGIRVTNLQARQIYKAAIAQVVDNLVEKAKRGEVKRGK